MTPAKGCQVPAPNHEELIDPKKLAAVAATGDRDRFLAAAGFFTSRDREGRSALGWRLSGLAREEARGSSWNLEAGCGFRGRVLETSCTRQIFTKS